MREKRYQKYQLFQNGFLHGVERRNTRNPLNIPEIPETPGYPPTVILREAQGHTKNTENLSRGTLGKWGRERTNQHTRKSSRAR